MGYKIMFDSQEGKMKGGGVSGGVWPAKSLENANPAREQKGLGNPALHRSWKKFVDNSKHPSCIAKSK